MNVLEKIISVIAPHTCLGCGAENNCLLCESCLQTVPLVPSRCYRCRAVTQEFAVCRSCRGATPLRQLAVYTHHRDLAKELIHTAKYERARAGIGEMAAQMAPLLALFEDDSVVLSAIPTASSRIRSRGYDHALLLARSLAQRSGLPSAPLLARVGQAHQVGSGRTQRLRQLQEAFRPVRRQRIRGAHVVLVDDVLTTGATLETAARVLKRAGAKRVSAIVFAQA